jgi:hypothetical protein
MEKEGKTKKEPILTEKKAKPKRTYIDGERKQNQKEPILMKQEEKPKRTYIDGERR